MPWERDYQKINSCLSLLKFQQFRALSINSLLNLHTYNENDIILINIIKLHLTTFDLIYYLIELMKDSSAEMSLVTCHLFVLFEWNPIVIMLLKTMESTTKKQ